MLFDSWQVWCAGSMRIDKFLWFARLARSRKLAQAMAEAGMMRLDGRRVEREVWQRVR